LKKLILCCKKAAVENTNLLMSAINYREALYVTFRKLGYKKVSEVEYAMRVLPVEIINADIETVSEAARIKSSNSISYADCFAAALAKMHKGGVVTGDKEFKTITNKIKIF
jgi:predicted nucleic acid-binding protein